VRNRDRVGRSEVQLAQGGIDGAASLLQVEAALRGGASLVAAMTPPPPPEAAPKQLADAARARGRLQLLNLSGTPLPVAGWAGGSAALSLAQQRVHERDAVVLAQLLH